MGLRVPQGSVLGPLLFVIFIDNFHNNIHQNTVVTYVDGTALSFADKDTHAIESVLQDELHILNKCLLTMI